MAERVDLTSPYVPDPRQATLFRVERIDLNWGAQSIIIEVSDGILRRHFDYEGSQAVTLMNLLNKANLTNNSLHKRILQRLLDDGKLVGTIAGTPD